MTGVATSWCGQSIERVEDAALLIGRGRYIDDLGVRPGTLHAAILRSPHAHAIIRADRRCGGAQAHSASRPLSPARKSPRCRRAAVVGVKAPIQCWPIAVERVRYVGEPVAVVVGRRPLPCRGRAGADRGRLRAAAAVIDPLAALDPKQSALHEGLGSNIASDRSFRYGDPEARFARAAHRVSVDGPLSAQFLHADRNLRPRRRLRSGRGRLRRTRQFHGAVQPARRAWRAR